jgi:CBS domain-containing protein
MLGELLDGLTVGDLVADTDAVSLDTTVDRILPRLLGARRSELPVVGAGGAVVGVISRTDYSAALALRQGEEPFRPGLGRTDTAGGFLSDGFKIKLDM